MTTEAELTRRARISAALKGRKMSTEQREKISRTVRAKQKASGGAATPVENPTRSSTHLNPSEAYRKAVEASGAALAKCRELEARVASLRSALAIAEDELEGAHELAMQAQSDEYAAKLRCR